MGKIKSIVLILIGGFLALFFYENWVTAPCIRIFGKEIIQLNTSIIILSFFALGFILGALTHFAWIQRRRKNSEPVSGEQQAPETQSPSQQENNQKK
jgi:hypothetical protein